MSALSMFCDQCEQTAHNTGCTTKGVCGKNPDVESAQKLLLYGVKGLSAYKSHARRLGKSDPELDAFVEDALFATMTNVNFDFDHLRGLILRAVEASYATMRMLEAAHVERLGEPGPVEVREGIEKAPGILVTGHDMADLLELLEQCEGSGVKVYTHGEMLPAHAYPKLSAFSCLAGHYGTAWQRQRWDFERFGGPVLATTNCVLIPWETNSYLGRLYTRGHAAVPGAKRLERRDFGPIIEHARSIGPLEPTAQSSRTVGWHHRALSEEVPALAAAIRDQSLRHLFLVGGCDGAEPGRNYFTKYVEATPPDTLVLTMGCGKYRFREETTGVLGGLPRLLDMGQCNDAFGAMQVIEQLAVELGMPVAALPLTVQWSWFEQKAIAVLLALLHRGFRGVALGPNLPAFVSDALLELMADEFGLRAVVSRPKEDVAEDMAMA